MRGQWGRSETKNQAMAQPASAPSSSSHMTSRASNSSGAGSSLRIMAASLLRARGRFQAAPGSRVGAACSGPHMTAADIKQQRLLEGEGFDSEAFKNQEQVTYLEKSLYDSLPV